MLMNIRKQLRRSCSGHQKIEDQTVFFFLCPEQSFLDECAGIHRLIQVLLAHSINLIQLCSLAFGSGHQKKMQVLKN